MSERAPPPVAEPSAEGSGPTTLAEIFAATAARYPERIAVDVPPSGGRPRRTATYAALSARADRFRRALEAFSPRGRIVAVFVPRETPDLYAAELGILSAGAAYTALDPAFPDERLKFILVDADVAACIATPESAARLVACGFPRAKIVSIADVPAGLPASPAESPSPAPSGTGDDLASVIYTSGPTGKPKGVLIEQRSIVGLVRSDVLEFGLRPDDRVAQGSSHAYDSSLEETWLAFAVGAAVVVLDDDAARAGPDLVGWLADENITVFCPPPTQLRATGCLDPQRALPRLRLLYVGGEALPRDVADTWAVGRRLVNGYGPTECTVTVVRGDVLPGGPITIGRPTPGHAAHILDPGGEPVADGRTGELYLSGPGLARGYLGRPELTSEKFPTHPRFGRIYRTGDAVVRRADGRLEYHGRLDAQVKFRGYRIELEAVETALVAEKGVRAAAACVQEDASGQTLVACVVPLDPASPPDIDRLKAGLALELPAYAVPARIAFVTALPTSTGGKLDRKALPYVAPVLADHVADAEAASADLLEEAVAAAFGRALGRSSPAPLRADFFRALGGDSLRAAEAVSLLRKDPQLASIAVRDLYEARTVEGVAARARAAIAEERAEETAGDDGATGPEHGGSRSPSESSTRGGAESGRSGIASSESPESRGRPLLAAMLQVVWLFFRVAMVGSVAYAAVFHATPALVEVFGLTGFLLASPLLLLGGGIAYTALAVRTAAAVKRALIGRYEALRAPVWGSFYVRHWMVLQAVRAIPWRLIQGTEYQCMALRALGAKIGRRVHLHRGVDLTNGGFDLLDLGDDVVVGQDAALRPAELDDGHIVVGPVVLGPGARLDVRAAVEAGGSVGAGSVVRPLSSVPRGVHVPPGVVYDGVPATFAGAAPPPSKPDRREREFGPLDYGTLLVIGRVLARALTTLPAAALILGAAHAVYGFDASSFLGWLAAPALDGRIAWALVWLAPLEVFSELVMQAALCRIMGRVRQGTVARFGLRRIRAELKIELTEAAGRRLSGTLFWPVFLRAAGMKVGRDAEISTIIDVVPELVDIGGRCFFADGVYLAGPVVDRGGVTYAPVRTGEGTFVGNHAILPGGAVLPDDVLIGVCTVADPAVIRPGTSWFGHPPMELGRRPETSTDVRLTHRPGPLRYATRVFWEALRFALPIVPALVGTAAYAVLGGAAAHDDLVFTAFVLAPAVGVLAAAALCLIVLAAKWILLGRVRAGEHPLWSCWCSRWDFHYVMWAQYARASLAALEGTPFLGWYLRAMGCRIGRRVVLGGGFAQVVDPDMLIVEDDATVVGHLQAHTFEDRVLKIAPVRIRKGAVVADGAVLFYGADIGERATVLPHSVVMKGESLQGGGDYVGCPTRLVRRGRALFDPRAETPKSEDAADATASLGAPRVAHLDAVRGAALIGMLYMHLVPDETGPGLLAAASSAFARFLYGKSAALFLTVLGAALALRARRPGIVPGFDRALFIRAALLYAGGHVLAATIWPTEVLRAAALAMLVVGSFAGRGPRVAGLIAVLGLVCSPFVVGYAAGFSGDLLDDGTHAGVVAFDASLLRCLLLNGPYPLAGWIVFPAFGVVLAGLATGTRRTLERTFFLGIGFAFAGHVLTSALGPVLTSALGPFDVDDGNAPWWIPVWTPTNAAFMILNGAFVAAAIAGVRWFVVGGPRTSSTPLALRALGRSTLSHYVVQLLVPYAILKDYFPEEDWPAGPGLAAFALYLACAIVVSRRWCARFGSGPLEHLVSRLAGPYRSP